MPSSDAVWPIAIVVLLITWVVVRAVAKRAFERRVEARLAVGSDGIIPGAGTIDLPATQPGAAAALLLHGFGDTPQTLHYLATSLHEQGWSVRVPLLPGHGRTIVAWAKTRAGDWLAAARAELDQLRRTHETVVVVGLSMGAALATLLVTDKADANRPDAATACDGGAPAPLATIQCLVLLAPYLVLPAWIRTIAGAYPLVGALSPYFSARGSFSILDPNERAQSLAYGATTPRLLHELGTVAHRAWLALPDITTPTLLVQSHADNRILPSVAENALARIGTSDKRLLWIDDGGHVITVDHGHAAVTACVEEWVDTHTPSRARARKVRPA